MLALLAAIGTGIYYAAKPGETTARAGGGTAVQGSGAVTTTESAQATGATTSPTIVLPNGPAQDLELVSHPDGAAVAITLQDQTTVTGTTPYEEPVPGGDITVSLTKSGYNPAVREISLDSPQSLTVWLDPKGLLLQSLVRFKCGTQPKQVAFTPDGKELWVSLLAGQGLEIYDPITGKKLDSIKLGKYGSVEIIFNKAGSRAYVSQMETASVFEIDTATKEVLRTFKTGGTWPKIMLLSPDEKTLWASNWSSNNVSEIDLATGKTVHRIPTVANPRGLYETADGRALYVAGFKSGELQKIDLATRNGKVIFKKTGGSMRHMAVDEKRGLLFIGDLTSNAVWALDLATDEVTKLADTDPCPNTIALSPDKRMLFVSCRGEDNPDTGYLTKGLEWGSVLVFDAASGEVLDAIVGGNQCTGLDVSPDGRLLAFSNFRDDDIWVYTVPDYQTMAAGNGGRAVAHLQDLAKD